MLEQRSRRLEEVYSNGDAPLEAIVVWVDGKIHRIRLVVHLIDDEKVTERSLPFKGPELFYSFARFVRELEEKVRSINGDTRSEV